ncbi:MAG: glycosyltransferase [Gemmatimonadota bacterium]
MTGIDLSVVVPSVNGWSDLDGCLAALEKQRPDINLEVLVADRVGESVRSKVRARYPSVRLLEAERGTTIPDLRAMAFGVAQGRSVAVIEDHVLVPQGWARQLLEAQGRGEDVVGGSVENAATERTVDWAAFLCEYSHLLPPLPEGPSDWLTGNNTVYLRSLLERYRAVTEQGRWENHLHDRLRADGVTLYCRPAIRVGHKKHYTIWEYLSQRYLYSRSYAGARVAGAPAPRRLAFGLAAMALPPVLFYRTVSRIWKKGSHRAELMRSLPLLALFVTGWAAGEVVGSWFGPGDALSKVT